MLFFVFHMYFLVVNWLQPSDSPVGSTFRIVLVRHARIVVWNRTSGEVMKGIKNPAEAGFLSSVLLRPERPEWTLQPSGRTRFR